MEASASRDLLLSLSEWVALHRLPGLETVAVVSKTKGANVFAWDDRRGLLAAGRQKRLTVFRLDVGREFVEVKEFGVPDMDNIGVFVDQNGKLIQDGRIIWSDTPASVVIHKPYAVARLPRHVEIRSLRAPSALVQTVVLRDVQKLVQTDNCILVALSNSVYGLLPVPIGAQIVQLTASGEFEDALALCKLLPPEDSNLRAAKEISIHMRQCDPLQEVAFLCRQQVKSSWTVCADVVNRGRRPPCSVGHGLICHWNFRLHDLSDHH